MAVRGGSVRAPLPPQCTSQSDGRSLAPRCALIPRGRVAQVPWVLPAVKLRRVAHTSAYRVEVLKQSSI